MQVLLASPRGFCAGVDRAIEIVERALALYGPPVYVLHEIVHNRHVLDDFRGRGVRFVEDLAEIPEGSVTIFDEIPPEDAPPDYPAPPGSPAASS